MNMNHKSNLFAVSLTAMLLIFSTLIHAYTNKKIVIAWSKGGGAHKSMLDALTGYLQDRYTVVPLNPFQTIWSSADVMNDDGVGFILAPARALGADLSDGEETYNYLLRKDATKLINILFNFGARSIAKNTNKIEARLKTYFNEEKPALIISVIPAFNKVLSESAQALGIPFLMIPPDFDTNVYFTQGKASEHMACTLTYNHDLILKKAAAAGIQEHQIKGFGFPLRDEFFAPKNVKALRKEFKIPDKKVVMIMMGATGSKKILDFVREVAKHPKPIHILACIGSNEEIRSSLNEESLPKHITMSVIGKTNRIADVMAISDVLITKSGPTSLCEAIETKLPVIIDATSQALDWEKMHREFVNIYEIGKVITDFKELKKALTTLLNDQHYVDSIKQKMGTLGNKNFKQSIINIIDSLVASGTSQAVCAHGICGQS